MRFVCRCMYMFLAVGLVLVVHASVFCEDWPQFRGPNRDGKSPSKGIAKSWRKKKPELVNEFQGAGKGYSSLSVVDGRIYTTGNSGQIQFVVCLNMESGEIEWKRDLPNHAILEARSTPTVDGTRLYVTSSDGCIFCMDITKEGEILWMKDFLKDYGGRLMSGWGYSESPMVDGERVVFSPGGVGALLVALNKESGKEIWRSGLSEATAEENIHKKDLKEGASYSSMIKAEVGLGSPLYLQLVGRGLIGVNCDDGKVELSHSLFANRESNICSPVYTDSQIVYSTSPNGGLCILHLDPTRQGDRLRQVNSKATENLECHHGGMVVHNGYLFFGSGENQGFPTCVRVSDGKLMWGGSFRGPGRGSASVVFVDGKIIFRYQNGVIAMIEADGEQYRPLGYFKQKVKSANQSWSHPVVVERKLLIREHDTIMVYDLE